MHTHIDDRGVSFMSVYDHVREIAGQINISKMYAGVVKAWHRHALQEDHWCVPVGHLKIGLFNSGGEPLSAELRLASAVPDGELVRRVEVPAGKGIAVFLGEQRPGVLRIPAGIWHGGVAVGGKDALLTYYVTRRYDAKIPDEERAAWDQFPFEWSPEQR